MGRIDPKLVVQGEESSLKTVKFKGETAIAAGHSHKFIVYEDDTVEIIKAITENPRTGVPEEHGHEYLGEYPYGIVSKVP